MKAIELKNIARFINMIAEEKTIIIEKNDAGVYIANPYVIISTPAALLPFILERRELTKRARAIIEAAAAAEPAGSTWYDENGSARRDPLQLQKFFAAPAAGAIDTNITREDNAGRYIRYLYNDIDLIGVNNEYYKRAEAAAGANFRLYSAGKRQPVIICGQYINAVILPIIYKRDKYTGAITRAAAGAIA